MVEIEKVGELKKYWIKCSVCDSILKFTDLDEKSKLGYDINGDPTTNYLIECPHCKKNNLTRSFTNEGEFTWRRVFRELRK